ncbi:MAG: lytic transglycosylase domain-containing protein [Myxococcales bacterium]|nr:lytic transglycosylase domain-containing protein [Myxococcales bacterium]
MAGVASWEAGILALEVRGEEPAGRRRAASRRRSLGVLLVCAIAAGTAGAVLGLVKQPDPRNDQIESFAWTTTAAIEAARRADERARSAEKALADAQSRIQALTEFGAGEELADWQEAEKLGVARFMKDSPALWADERRRVEAAIVRESRRNGLDPLLVAAVIQIESHFDPFAVSGAGACGLMQLMPPTAQWLSGESMRPAYLFNPVLNIELGTTYLAQLMKDFGGDLNQALIAYNAGPSVAKSLRRGSRAWKRLEVYPKAVLTAYKALLVPPQTMASR